MHPKTTSQALRTIGRIRAIEDPIRSGLLGFYKAESLISPPAREGSEEKEEMERHLSIFSDFCFTFERVVLFEQNNDSESLENWLTETIEHEKASRIDTYIGIRSFMSDSNARNTQLRVFMNLCTVANRILEGNINRSEVKTSVSKLEEIRRKIEETLGPEKKTSEKILSGRTPFI